MKDTLYGIRGGKEGGEVCIMEYGVGGRGEGFCVWSLGWGGGGRETAYG